MIPIQRLWAYLMPAPIVDADLGDVEEAVAQVTIAGVMYPLIAADEERLEQLRPIAQRLAAEQNVRIRLVCFECRVELEEVVPS